MVLDYSVDVTHLEDSDFILEYGELGNFSVAGFEMKLRRHVSHYLITYYLPSGWYLIVCIKSGEWGTEFFLRLGTESLTKT